MMYYISKPGNDNVIYRIETLFDINDPPQPVTIDVITNTEIEAVHPFGLAVDDEGNIYFTGEAPFEVAQIFKIDPDPLDPVLISDREIATNIDAVEPYEYPDLLYKDGHIYVTNRAGPDGEKILKLNKDLKLVDSFGVAATEFIGNQVEGEFFGPSRFLATSNKKIYVIDEEPYVEATFNTNRIVSFDTEFGNWDTYMPQEVETDLFSFYY